jgi:hypothetical protein
MKWPVGEDEGPMLFGGAGSGWELKSVDVVRSMLATRIKLTFLLNYWRSGGRWMVGEDEGPALFGGAGGGWELKSVDVVRLGVLQARSTTIM